MRNNFAQLLTAKGQVAKDKARVSKPSGDFELSELPVAT
jgi:hypothetical protein